MEKRTLEQILKKEKQNRCEKGMFGIAACKEAIKFEVEYFHKSLYQLLETYVERANNDICFNKTMVLACWELINEQ